MLDANTQAQDRFHANQDQIEEQLSGVKYTDDAFHNEMDDMEDDIFAGVKDLADHKYPIGSTAWYIEARNYFLAFTSIAKERAQIEAEEESLNS